MANLPVHLLSDADWTVAALNLRMEDLLGLPEADVPAHNRPFRAALQQDMTNEPEAENQRWRGGVRSLAAGLDRAMRGWPEGLERLQALTEGLDDLVPTPQSRRRTRAWGDDGDEIILDRVFAGQSEMYRTMRRAVRTGVTRLGVVAEWGINGNASQQDLFWTGAALTLLAQLLEPAGYGCELSLVAAVAWNRRPRVAMQKNRYGDLTGWTHAGEQGDLLAVHLRLKDAGETLSAETVISCAAHIGVWRSLGFACTQFVPWPCTHGFGSAAEAALVLPALQRAGWVDAHIVVPRLSTARQTVGFLQRVLQDVSAANLFALEV